MSLLGSKGLINHHIYSIKWNPNKQNAKQVQKSLVSQLIVALGVWFKHLVAFIRLKNIITPGTSFRKGFIFSGFWYTFYNKIASLNLLGIMYDNEHSHD